MWTRVIMPGYLCHDSLLLGVLANVRGRGISSTSSAARRLDISTTCDVYPLMIIRRLTNGNGRQARYLWSTSSVGLMAQTKTFLFHRITNFRTNSITNRTMVIGITKKSLFLLNLFVSTSSYFTLFGRPL